MGRKNGKVRRQNEKGRLQRGMRGISPSVNAFPDQPRIPLEDLVLPDGQCSFQGRKKARFGTQAKAAKALVQAQHERKRTGSTHVEKRYYKCPEGGCGGFHLSSRESFDEGIWKQRRDQFEERALARRIAAGGDK